jgi:hypothetical protein
LSPGSKRLPENLSDIMLAPVKGDSQLRDSRGLTPHSLFIEPQRARTTVFASAKVRQSAETTKQTLFFFSICVKKK